MCAWVVFLALLAVAEAGHTEVVVLADLMATANAYGVCDVVAALVADVLDAAAGSTAV